MDRKEKEVNTQEFDLIIDLLDLFIVTQQLKWQQHFRCLGSGGEGV